MKYFGLIIVCICLGDCADNADKSVADIDASASENYATIGPLKNYGGIFSPRYDYGQRGQNYGPWQNNYGQPWQNNAPWQYYGQGGQYYGQGGQFYGQAGAFIGNGRYQGNGVGIAGGLGLSAALSAGIGAGLAANLGNAIGVGINADLQLNVNANIDISNQEDIVRPCNLDDWQCIRKFFATNSQCSPAYGPVPDPLFLAQSTVNIPIINLSLLQTNVRITGLGNARVRDFYVNRVTGNLVFTIDIQNFNNTSPRNYMKYHRRGRESFILADISAFALAQVSLTVVIPRLPNLRLDLAEIHADYDDDAPTYNFGPGISNSTDLLAVSANAQLTANLQVVIRETLLIQAQLLAAIYIQQNICDFGLKLSSV